ncbi:MAG: A/G-specific adenine glycosylase [Chloroflexi bacterium]|nr:MAG: A/G-specific adenine glycosylase [Chloroflexota bacterium]
MNEIAAKLLAWWDADHADLPWRRTRDPYAIWVAEVMLQQTQISTVIPYFERWMARFPTVEALAGASLSEVLKMWEGLGYYSRARHLHAAAQQVVAERNGRLPTTVSELMQLKGIGRYTAGAIASIAFDQPAPVLDGNVIRVLTRLYDIDADITRSAIRRQLWQLAESLVPAHRPGAYNQALMELGQVLCQPARPLCALCPLAELCQARQAGTQLERPVRPPRRRTPHYDVVAGIIWQNGRPAADAPFLITQRPLDALLGGLWEFPGGKQEPGENLPDALKREIQEELGITIKIGRFLTSIKHAYTHFRITLHAFHATHIAGQPQHIGVADHAWVTLNDLHQYPFAITDRKIIAALNQELT